MLASYDVAYDCAHADNRTNIHQASYAIFLLNFYTQSQIIGPMVRPYTNSQLYYSIIFDCSPNIINRTEYVDVWVLQQKRQWRTKAQRISNTSNADVQLRKRYKLVITNCIGHIYILYLDFSDGWVMRISKQRWSRILILIHFQNWLRLWKF